MISKYKTGLLTVGTIVVAMLTTSSYLKGKNITLDNSEIELTAYNNLITYQEGEMYVYKTGAPEFETVNRFQKMAASKLRSNELLPTSNSKASLAFNEKDPSAFYEQDLNAGVLSFNKGIKEYHGNSNLRLPGQQRANDISLKFIKEVGLAPKNIKELKMLHSGGLRAGAAGSEKVIDVLRTVTYGRMLNGVPVYGAGSKIIVHVGDKGEVVGVNSRWKQVDKKNAKSLNRSSLKDAKKAELEMRRQLAQDYGKNAKFKIKDMYLAYYDGGKNYIQPAYFFQVDVTLPKVKERPKISFDYVGIIAALSNPPEAIIPAEEDPEAQEYIKKAALKKSRIKNISKRKDVE